MIKEGKIQWYLRCAAEIGALPSALPCSPPAARDCRRPFCFRAEICNTFSDMRGGTPQSKALTQPSNGSLTHRDWLQIRVSVDTAILLDAVTWRQSVQHLWKPEFSFCHKSHITHRLNHTTRVHYTEKGNSVVRRKAIRPHFNPIQM